MKIFKFVVALAVLSALVSCGSLADNQELSSNGKSLDATAYTSGLPAVQLINAKTRLQKKGLSSTYEVYLAGDIELENIAYTKNVKVVYSVDGGAWLEADASYVKSLGNNREHWTFSTIVKTFSTGGDPRAGYSGPKVSIQFALKYEVNGTVYWDNNGGAGVDYRVTTAEGSGDSAFGPAVLTKQNVLLTYATYSDYPSTYLRGYVALKKSNGSVGNATIVFTTDGWNTVKTVAVSTYANASFDDQEIHYFSDYSSNTWDIEIEFAISYELNGVVSWDNNMNQNYMVKGGVTAPY